MGTTWFEIRVQGALSPDWAEWFEEMEIRQDADGETTLAGWMVDQAALHGCLARIRNLNLTLLAVNRAEPLSSSRRRSTEQGERHMMLMHIPGDTGTGRIKPLAADDGACARMGADEAEKILVVSYSLTGNNDALAESVAKALRADHRRIIESRRRSMATVVFDVMLNRTPRGAVDLTDIDRYDLVLFVGPVWMGQVASPFRGCFNGLREKLARYGFVTICGGADGPNPGLAEELRRRLGGEAEAVVELHIAELLPIEPEPERKDTMAYRLDSEETEKLTGAVVRAISSHTTQRSEV